MAVSSANRSNTLGVNEGAHDRKQAHSTRRNVRNHFLSATFKEIPGFTLNVNEAAIALSGPDKDISRLQSEVRSFYNQIDVDCVLPQATGNFQYDLYCLYSHLCVHLPKDWNIDIVRECGEHSPIKFVVYKLHNDFPEYTLWNVPISKLESVDEETKNLLLAIFAMLHRNDMFTYPDENYEMLYTLGQMDYDFGHTDENGNVVFDDNAEYWDDYYKEWALRYVNGDINELFNEIKHVEQSELDGEGLLTDMVSKMIEVYRMKQYNNQNMLNIAEELVSLCKEEWLSDFHISMVRNYLGDDFASEESITDEIMDFGRLFYFVYNPDDPIAENMMELLNADSSSFEQGALLSYSFIDIDDVKERMANSFPERWVNVYEKFISELSR